MKKIYLVRHGESQSQSGDCPESEKDAPLSIFGRRQARYLRRRAELAGADLVLVSPMARARETFTCSGLTAKTVQLDSRLVESDWGAPGFYEGAIRALENPAGPGLEDFEPDRHRAELVPLPRRVRDLLDEITRSRHAHVVLFGHWGLFAEIFIQFFDLKPRGLYQVNESRNTSLSLLTVDATGRRGLGFWNDVGHLPPGIRRRGPVSR